MTNKPLLTSLWRNHPDTPEGKYLVKRRDGSVVEWPHFVLGARDPHTPAALRAYAASAKLDPECTLGYIVDVLALANEFEAYRREHGDGDPSRGRHRLDDPETIAEMRKGRSA
jgi:hypothetical protein